MTIVKTSLIAALGLLTAAALAPASAGPLTSAKPAAEALDTGMLQLVTDRGSWVEPKTRWKRDHAFGYEGRYERFDGHHKRKHFKKKKRRKVFKRGFRKGYSRGYDEGYYEGRRHSRFERRHRHRYHRHVPDYRFGGGFYFGDGHFGGGNFRFRY